MVLVCLPLAAPIGLSPLLILTLRGPERVLVVSTEPPDDCLTTPGVGRPGDGAVARAVDQVHPDAHPESMRGFVGGSGGLEAKKSLCSQNQPQISGLFDFGIPLRTWVGGGGGLAGLATPPPGPPKGHYAIACV